jgi:SAM-dependent methyltransferase
MVESDIKNWSADEQAEFEKAAQEGIIPPQRLWAMVGAPTDFYAQGRGFFDILVNHGRISAHSAVLDVGCGLGKTAIHFATYLQSPGFYEGFDIERPSVEWCIKAISSRFPLIRFKHIDLYSEMYNRAAGKDASKFIFPYASSTFDMVFLASVFTHMFDAQVDNYLREISRVLKPGGTCLSTYYLLNDEKRAGIRANTSMYTFSHKHNGSYIERLNPPEGAVAHEESRIYDLQSAAGFKLIAEPRYGHWASRKVQDQDFLLTQKVSNNLSGDAITETVVLPGDRR